MNYIDKINKCIIEYSEISTAEKYKQFLGIKYQSLFKVSELISTIRYPKALWQEKESCIAFFNKLYEWCNIPLRAKAEFDTSSRNLESVVTFQKVVDVLSKN